MLDIPSLLSSTLTSPNVVRLLHSISEEPVIKRYFEVYYYSFRSTGISFLFEEDGDRLCTVFLYNQGYQNFQRYNGILPLGLEFDLERSRVHSLLGKPTASGGNKHITELNEVRPTWDIYEHNQYDVNLTYSKDNTRIDLVSIDLHC